MLRIFFPAIVVSMLVALAMAVLFLVAVSPATH
jgi:hypothetical protein